MICGRTMGTGVLEYFFECDLVEERQQRARSTTVRVREVSEDDYGLFVWPSSLILAQYLFEGGRDLLQGKRVLEVHTKCLSCLGYMWCSGVDLFSCLSSCYLLRI
eukprot:TRINITY_DN856_c0_g1_i1.p1 TRINITY_DN856_c0_g1~~TRINITY_DN856_c0_g1_i1.p1  ORF type:complete len:105 (+),score=3.22 TRINITY_DN856_c0_g1_i1:92-406(+)